MIRIGRQVVGVAAIILGGVDLGWRDFALPWQHVGPETPHHMELALLTGVLLVGAGAATIWSKTARPGALALGAIYAVFTALQAVRFVGSPWVFDAWSSSAEQLALVAGCMAAYAGLTARGEGAERLSLAARWTFGVCSLFFGAGHFVYFKGAADFVPAWIPPSQAFWTAATGAAHLLAGVAILTGAWAGLAARLAALMYLGFGLLVWLPTLIAHPQAHMAWGGNAVNFTLVAAAWMIADTIAQFPPRDGALFGLSPRTPRP